MIPGEGNGAALPMKWYASVGKCSLNFRIVRQLLLVAVIVNCSSERSRQLPGITTTGLVSFY